MFERIKDFLAESSNTCVSLHISDELFISAENLTHICRIRFGAVLLDSASQREADANYPESALLNRHVSKRSARKLARGGPQDRKLRRLHDNLAKHQSV